MFISISIRFKAKGQSRTQNDIITYPFGDPEGLDHVNCQIVGPGPLVA